MQRYGYKAKEQNFRNKINRKLNLFNSKMHFKHDLVHFITLISIL